MSIKNNSNHYLGPSSSVDILGIERRKFHFSLEEVKKYLSYDINTGLFRWISVSKFHNEKLMTVAGVKSSNGYITIQISGIKVRAHRLAWFYVFGYMPVLVDHMNGDKSDNRISNLRDVTALENAQNHIKTKLDVRRKMSGLPVGVKRLKSGNYQARATVNGRCYSLGSFKTKEDAHERYKEFTGLNHSNPAVE